MRWQGKETGRRKEKHESEREKTVERFLNGFEVEISHRSTMREKRWSFSSRRFARSAKYWQSSLGRVRNKQTNANTLGVERLASIKIEQVDRCSLFRRMKTIWRRGHSMFCRVCLTEVDKNVCTNVLWLTDDQSAEIVIEENEDKRKKNCPNRRNWFDTEQSRICLELYWKLLVLNEKTNRQNCQKEEEEEERKRFHISGLEKGIEFPRDAIPIISRSFPLVVRFTRPFVIWYLACARALSKAQRLQRLHGFTRVVSRPIIYLALSRGCSTLSRPSRALKKQWQGYTRDKKENWRVLGARGGSPLFFFSSLPWLGAPKLCRIKGRVKSFAKRKRERERLGVRAYTCVWLRKRARERERRGKKREREEWERGKKRKKWQ